MQAAIGTIVAAARQRGLPVGRPTNAADIKGHLDQGFRFFQGSSELVFVAAGARPLLEAAGKSAPDTRNRPLY